MPGLRRQGRTLALQLLYQTEMNPELGTETIEQFWSSADASKRARAFAMQLFEGTRANLTAIDGMLSDCLENWKLSRLSVVVRNLLRMAVWEMVHLGESPHAVVIDEAVSVARDFEDDESARFVNGVLQRCWEAGRADDAGTSGTGGTGA